MQNIQIDRRVLRSRKALQNSLLELMIEQEFADITVTDIVNHADYNRTTFYRHFNHKEHLADELIDDQLKKLISIFKDPYKKENYIYLHKLSPRNIQIFNHIYDNHSFYKLWHKFTKLPGFKEAFLDSLTRFFKNDIVLVPINTKLDDTLYNSFYANGILGIIIEWIEDGLIKPPKYMAEQLVEILNHYPGESYINES